MRVYHCYPITDSGSIAGARQDFACVDDAAAIDQAYARFSDQPFEVWEAARKVYTRTALTAEHAV